MDGHADDRQSTGGGWRPALGRALGPLGRRLGRGTGRAVTSPWGRRIRIIAAVAAVSLVGVVIGALLGGRVETDIGPFRAQMAITPNLTGGTTVRIPPLGALQFNSHDGPAHLTVQLGALDQKRTEALINDPGKLNAISASAVDDARTGAMRLALRTVAAALLGSLIIAALVFRNVRRVAWSGFASLLITGGSLGVAGLTAHPQSFEEPRYEGLLVNAPAIIGDARSIATNYGKYTDQLQRLVGNVSKLYTAVSALPVYEPAPGTTRVLHISDMHLNPSAWQLIRTVVEQFNIDVVIDTGDLTDWGSEPEKSFVGSIGSLKKPYVFIRGNHDSSVTAAAVAKQPNAIVLDNSVTTVAGLNIAGIGDPRFTPDKETSPAGSGLTSAVADQVIGAGEKLASTVRSATTKKIDIALVHDPASAGPLSGVVPLVLAGHIHQREVLRLPQVTGEQPTQLLVEGSTGGAGLRGLEGEKPTPLSMSVLYFNPAQKLQAYDDITVGGTGQTQVSLERHIIADPAVGDKRAPVTPTPSHGGPSSTPAPTGPSPGASLPTNTTPTPTR